MCLVPLLASWFFSRRLQAYEGILDRVKEYRKQLRGKGILTMQGDLVGRSCSDGTGLRSNSQVLLCSCTAYAQFRRPPERKALSTRLSWKVLCIIDRGSKCNSAVHQADMEAVACYKQNAACTNMRNVPCGLTNHPPPTNDKGATKVVAQYDTD